MSGQVGVPALPPSDHVTEAPCWYQCVCLCGLPCAVQHHGVGGEAGHGETHSHSKS